LSKPRPILDAAAAAPGQPPAASALLDRCLAGDAQAWHELDRLYRPQAMTFLRRLGLGSEAEDACQEVMVQMFRYLPRFEQRAELRTWIYRVCVSQAARVRRRALVPRPLRWLAGWPEPATLPEWSARHTADVVERALRAMGNDCRAVFVLYELEGLSTEEIARVLGRPAASVRRRLHHARARFEAFLRTEESPAGDSP
jgi:RNA polymerase sigma-70 factor (ECF subfamily)